MSARAPTALQHSQTAACLSKERSDSDRRPSVNEVSAAATSTSTSTSSPCKSRDSGRGREGRNTETTLLRADLWQQHACNGLARRSAKRAAYERWRLGLAHHATQRDMGGAAAYSGQPTNNRRAPVLRERTQTAAADGRLPGATGMAHLPTGTRPVTNANTPSTTPTQLDGNARSQSNAPSAP